MIQKSAEAIGSAAPDPNASLASVDAIPKPTIANKPPAGHTGPRGMQPRQTYSRVNTGAPPTPEAGSSSQKGLDPRGLEFLPKLSEVAMPEMTMTTTPTLNDMLKAAMSGTVSSASITAEAIRNIGGEPEAAKTAASGTLPTDTGFLNKLADAIGYIANEIEKGAEIHLPHPSGGDVSKPGGGPGALHVMEAKADGKNPMQPGHTGGKAPPGPSMEHGANPHMPDNAMATNATMRHGEQPIDPMGNKHAMAAGNMARLAKLGSAPATALSPEASSVVAAVRTKFAALQKNAEDAINPAQISAGAAVPPAATASGEGVPSQPGDVTSQEHMIDSNRAAIDYTKRDAKADPVKDVGRVFNETPMKDPVLHQVFDNSDRAGVKMSSAMSADALRVSAARALLSKVASEIKATVAKKKESTMGSPPPPGVPSPAFTQ